MERWEGIIRSYKKEDVARLGGSVRIEHTLARMGAEKLWRRLNTDSYVHTLGALTGGQAVQIVRGGLKAVYVSGWQVAADANEAGETYPDQSLYPANSVPKLVRRINKALHRQDQRQHLRGESEIDWLVPLVADAEAGFGGPHNASELMGMMIEAGAAGVHFEDQLGSEKKCGHLGGKVLVPTRVFIRTLQAARFIADMMDVPTVLIARTDAESAKYIVNDVDPLDQPFIDRTVERTFEGYYRFRGGLEAAIARGLAFAPYADVLWCETSTPDLDEAGEFARAIHQKFPGKFLAYNCSPSFNWRKFFIEKHTITNPSLIRQFLANFQKELGKMGYKFQFVTLAGFHALNYSMFKLAQDYAENGMAAYSQLQEAESAAQALGYTAVRHQSEVGVDLFDARLEAISGGVASTIALAESTEKQQFKT